MNDIMKTLEEVREIFASDRFATVAAGATIDEIGENYAVCSMKIIPNHLNARDAVMGGAIFTLADFAFAVATNHENIGTVTLTSQISFMGVAKGDTLIARTRLIKDGRRNCFYEIDVTDNLGTPVAMVSTTGAHI